MELIGVAGGYTSMAQKDSRRLYLVLPHLYPDLNGTPITNNEYRPELADYLLQNDSDGTGSYVIWQNDEVAEPTAQELADAKEGAINAEWWRVLRWERDQLLKQSDWSQGNDIPSDLKSSYVTYRTDLRDLPENVTKPDFETLNNLAAHEWNIKSLMPTKPTE